MFYLNPALFSALLFVFSLSLYPQTLITIHLLGRRGRKSVGAGDGYGGGVVTEPVVLHRR